MRAQVARAAAEKEPGNSCKRCTSTQSHGDDGGAETKGCRPPLRHISPSATVLEDRWATSTGRARVLHAAPPKKHAGSGVELHQDDGRREAALLSTPTAAAAAAAAAATQAA
ncbi:unnamed protein product [Urochloa humidicola]